ncbi:MAG: hypothetical protein PHC34_07165 [Candidatus Gastranaerophilales bacterium]|nr:hypothetical protein [Candidatus Gastranaerophilales bacterium]
MKKNSKTIEDIQNFQPHWKENIKKGDSMKKFVLLFALMSIISSPCLAYEKNGSWGLSDGEKLKQYDKNGSYQGYYKQQGDKTKVYNRNSGYEGYYKQQGNKIKKYNRNGSYEGYYQK